MGHDDDGRDDDERDDDEHDEEPTEAEAAPAAKAAAGHSPAPAFPDDALHASFEHARRADLDAAPEREATKWFTYTLIGIAVYAAVVIGWIYL